MGLAIPGPRLVVIFADAQAKITQMIKYPLWYLTI
jgi:hypothetical protein